MSGRGSFEVGDHNGKQDVGFDDVAGVDEARAELTETIEFLKNPERFSRLGGRVPRGILLYGPPGTGKTLLARAAAKEAGVAFLAASGSSFQEKFAGLGAARVRHLFAKGRKLSPCIIFIDEIDALGRQRGRGGDSASADQDQTLNQLLVEMDGFDQSSAVVVIASTNRPDILDKALTRPGRFDREIAVNLADVSGREAILKVHARNLKLEDRLRSAVDCAWNARLLRRGTRESDERSRDRRDSRRSEAIGRQHIEICARSHSDGRRTTGLHDGRRRALRDCRSRSWTRRSWTGR